MEWTILNSELIISINKDLYSEDVLFKCFYWYGKDFSTDISLQENSYTVKLQPKDKVLSEDEWTSVVTKVKRDLVDFKLRDIVTKETKTIRELIVAKAFAYHETPIDPITEISDPVGFSPTN